MKYTIICDPPEGWLYGFPKPFTFEPSKPGLTDEEADVELIKWFLDEGYKPRYPDWHKHIRFWSTDDV